MIYSFSELITEAKFKIKKVGKEIDGKFVKNKKIPICVDSDGNKLSGWKAILKQKKCIKMSAKEIHNKKKGQIAGQRKRDAKMNKILLKRKKLDKKRGGIKDITEANNIDIKPIKEFIRDNLNIKIKDFIYNKKDIEILFFSNKDLDTVYNELIEIDEILEEYYFDTIIDKSNNYFSLIFY